MSQSSGKDVADTYEMERDENIRQKTMLLNAILQKKRALNSSSNVTGPKRTKRTKPKQPSVETGRDFSLRPRAASVVPQNDGDVLDKTSEGQNAVSGRGKRVRKCTRKQNMWARANENLPLIKMEWNELNHLIGPAAKEFPHVVTSLIRTKHFPLNVADWREVDISHKEKLVERLGCIYEIDDCLEDHIYETAKKKWKDFKHDLKKARFDPLLSREKLIAACDPRVDPKHWEWLVDHWLSEEAQERSYRNKKNRSNVLNPHYTGAKSVARATQEWAKELGRPLHRYEVFLRSHTPKKAVLPEATKVKIAKINDAITTHPELIDQPIQKGDLFNHVFGRDPRGYVRAVVMGPTPSKLGIEGWRQFASTNQQREVSRRNKAEKKVDDLKWVVEQLIDEVGELRDRVGAREDTPDTELANTPNRGSNHTPIGLTPHDEIRGSDDENDEQRYTHTSNAEVHLPAMETTPIQPTMHFARRGHEVVLLSTERPHDQPVAIATIQTTNPETRVGGCVLGSDCYEVVVSTVITREDDLLPRQYGKVKTLADSIGRSIAWLHMNITSQEAT